jgi:hypothetical protein
MKRTAIFYFLILTIVGLGIVALLHFGAKLPPPAGDVALSAKTAAQDPSGSMLGSMLAGLSEIFSSPLSHLFLQLLVIIATSRLLGGLFARFGQPSVIGEMAAGIILGPSLFGLLVPEVFQFVLPPPRSAR